MDSLSKQYEKKKKGALNYIYKEFLCKYACCALSSPFLVIALELRQLNRLCLLMLVSRTAKVHVVKISVSVQFAALANFAKFRDKHSFSPSFAICLAHEER